MRPTLFLIGFFFVLNGSWANLVFPTTEAILTAKIGENSVSTSYEFKNEGPTEITVSEVTASCGCTVPVLEKKTYTPGEKGLLTVRYDVGDRQGRNEAWITVKTVVGVTRLRLTVDMPLRAEISPRLVLFRKADSEKTNTILFKADLPVVITGIVASDPAFTVSSVNEVAGERHRLVTRLTGIPAAAPRVNVTVTSRGVSGKIYRDVFYLRYLP